MANSIPGSTEYGQMRQCAEASSSKLVVVDLSDVHRRRASISCAEDKASSSTRIGRIVVDLVDAGIPSKPVHKRS
jgi:hypothetical protein